MITVRSIPHIYRNVKRWTELVAALSKYGLADWLAQTNIDFAKDHLKHRDGEALARLKTGQRVVVKVQHAGIEPKVNEDLEVLAGLAQLAEQFPEFKPYRPVQTVAEMGRTLRRELDFGREERNLHQFAELFREDL